LPQHYGWKWREGRGYFTKRLHESPSPCARGSLRPRC
jgi:hypothetical protein